MLVKWSVFVETNSSQWPSKDGSAAEEMEAEEREE